MENIYITAIIVGGVVILVVVILLRKSLTRGRLSLARNKIVAELEAEPRHTEEKTAAGKGSPLLQPGKTVVDDDILIKSRISAPRDSDLKVRKSKLLGSEIEIRDSTAGEDETND